MKYESCPRKGPHLLFGVVAFAAILAFAIIAGSLFPIPNSFIGTVVSVAFGFVLGLAGVRSGFMLGHYMICKEEE